MVSLYLLSARTRTFSIEIVADSNGMLALSILLMSPIEDTYPFITRWYGEISFNNVIADLIGILELGVIIEFPTRTTG
jgi:hypothetical protein